MRYRLRSIIYLHGYAVTKIKTTFAAQPPPLRVVSSEQVAHIACSGFGSRLLLKGSFFVLFRPLAKLALGSPNR